MGLATGFDDDGGSDWLLMESWYVSSMMATSRGTIFGKMITENRAAEENVSFELIKTVTFKI